MVFSGCEKDGNEVTSSSSASISVSPSTLRLSKAADSGYVYVTASNKWSVTGFKLSCDCTPHTGGAGTTRVLVKVKKTSYHTTHYLHFSVGGASTTLTVKQL